MREPKPTHAAITRYFDADGRRCSKATPGAKKVREKSESYYAWIGGTRWPLHTTDIGQAWVELRRLQKRLSDRAHGITDEYSDHAVRPLAEHIADWLAAVGAKGTTAKQIQLLCRSVTTLAGLAGWDRLGQLSADSAAKALAALGALKDARYPAGRGAQTRNHYLSHLRQFARWAVEDRRISHNPLLSLRPVNVQADRRHDRRAPTDEEVARLYEYLYGPSPDRRGMTGPQRALCYKLGMATGFRASELRSLTRASFDLEAGAITVRAAYDKRRRPATQQIPAWLVEDLKAWFAASGECWGRLAAVNPGDVLRKDLEDAGIPYSIDGPDGPLFFDFHSLRHYYCTWAANLPGISPRTLLALTRHSTVELALKVYGKVRLPDVRAATDQIPKPPGATTPAPKEDKPNP